MCKTDRTGTAMTEANEFADIYGLEVVEIPTNKPIARLDEDDEVYRTTREKYEAMIEEIEDCASRGQPVLVGTTSIEKSETLSEPSRCRYSFAYRTAFSIQDHRVPISD